MYNTFRAIAISASAIPIKIDQYQNLSVQSFLRIVTKIITALCGTQGTLRSHIFHFSL